MTEPKTALPALAGLFLLLLLPTTGRADDRADLARLLDAFLAGASTNDAAAHERFWAEDLIYTSSDGRRFGKAEIMASLAGGETAGDEGAEQPPEYSARDITIRVFGDTAVVTFRLVAQREDEIVGEYFNTGVFRRREPGWQAVTWQATRASESGNGTVSGE